MLWNMAVLFHAMLWFALWGEASAAFTYSHVWHLLRGRRLLMSEDKITKSEVAESCSAAGFTELFIASNDEFVELQKWVSDTPALDDVILWIETDKVAVKRHRWSDSTYIASDAWMHYGGRIIEPNESGNSCNVELPSGCCVHFSRTWGDHALSDDGRHYLMDNSCKETEQYFCVFSGDTVQGSNITSGFVQSTQTPVNETTQETEMNVTTDVYTSNVTIETGKWQYPDNTTVAENIRNNYTGTADRTWSETSNTTSNDTDTDKETKTTTTVNENKDQQIASSPTTDAELLDPTTTASSNPRGDEGEPEIVIGDENVWTVGDGHGGERESNGTTVETDTTHSTTSSSDDVTGSANSGSGNVTRDDQDAASGNSTQNEQDRNSSNVTESENERTGSGTTTQSLSEQSQRDIQTENETTTREENTTDTDSNQLETTESTDDANNTNNTINSETNGGSNTNDTIKDNNNSNNNTATNPPIEMLTPIEVKQLKAELASETMPMLKEASNSNPPKTYQKCPCACGMTFDPNPPPDVLQSMMTKIQKELKVETTSLSSSKNRIQSSKDERSSSMTMGVLAITLCVIEVCIIVGLDCTRLCQHSHTRSSTVSEVACEPRGADTDGKDRLEIEELCEPERLF